MENHEYWMKVDNAGKVFHAVSNYSRSSTFRLSMYVNDDVDPIVLQNALNITLPRFESFKVKIKNGLFWNYFVTWKLSNRIYNGERKSKEKEKW